MRRMLCLAALICLMLQGQAPAHAQQRPVQAHDGSIAIGGNVSGSTFSVGIPAEQLEALVRDRTRLLEKYSDSLERVGS
jgi:hypothetical protein